MGIRKRLDDRIRRLIERGIETSQRSVLVIVGDYGRDQVVNLHRILQKSTPAERTSSSKRVLWCYKKELGFSSHKKKRMKKLKRDQQRGLLNEQQDEFELFVSQTDISWCYYRDTHRILGQTFGLLVLQDFEALTPNLLARTIETIQGGGIVVFLLRTVASLKQLYAMSMDVHARYRTESGGDVVPRFNERFILSLAQCRNCLVCDDELNVLPLSRKTLTSLGKEASQAKSSSSASTTKLGEEGVTRSAEDAELRELKDSLLDTPHVGVLVELAKTVDQAKAVLVFLEACSEKTMTPTVALTAARGRGKSAALGLALAGSISLGYSTVCVTAPEPENLQSVFEFCLRGLDALKYQPHADYTVAYNAAKGRETTKCVVSIQIHRTHRQLIRYVVPDQVDQFATAEIVAIDEAAAIPLPVVRALVKPTRITLLSSTVNGYEGTGRALSLKLLQELRHARGKRQELLDAAEKAASAVAGVRVGKGEFKVHEQRWTAAASAAASSSGESSSFASATLREVELSTPIRYATGDQVEAWLNKLLCLDCGSSANLKLSGGAPAPADCELYSVNRDALFSFHKLSEAFLQKLMGLYTSAHYKNTPNDLQMLSDAPAHSLFCLLSPRAEKDADSLPDVLAVVQVALEGGISRKAVEAQLARGHRSAGDLIPWTISQQFGDSKFANLSGARIVRIAVHPSVQGMGYGSRAMDLLYRFYNGEMVSLINEEEDEDEEDTPESESHGSSSDEDGHEQDPRDGLRGENVKPRKQLPPLLLPLTEVDAPRLDWIGTSFGLTLQLHNFWAKRGMKLLYLRQTKNELTGEHSAIMLRALPNRTGFDDSWLGSYLADVRQRFLSLLGGPFRDMDVRLAVAVLENVEDNSKFADKPGAAVASVISAEELDFYLQPHDLKRLELYGRNLCDHHLVTDLLPTICRLCFTRRFGSEFSVSSVQAALLTGIGLQNRTVDNLTVELGLPSNQVLAMFNKAVRKISIALNGIVEAREKKSLLSDDNRKKAEAAVERMRDVTRQTLDEDARVAAKEAVTLLQPNLSRTLPPEVQNDPELMQYVVKGTDEQWEKALDGKKSVGGIPVQIESIREKRRTLNDNDVQREVSHVAAKTHRSDNRKAKKGRRYR
jgi:N-acetyltransferase 10